MMTVRDALWFLGGLLSALVAGFALLFFQLHSGRPRVTRTVMWSAMSALVAGVSAFMLYAWRGNPNQIGDEQLGAVSNINPSTASAKAHGSDSLDTMLARLERRLRGGGGTAADWALLGQTYDFLGRRADAVNARDRHEVALATTTVTAGPWTEDFTQVVLDSVNDALTARAPRGAADIAPTIVQPPANTKTQRRAQQLLSAADSARRRGQYKLAEVSYAQLAALGQMSAQSWADYADVVASMNAGQLDGLPQQYIEAALKLDPTNEKALWLKASAEHEDQHYALAASTWTVLLAVTPPASADAKIFAANLAEDRRLAVAGKNIAVADGAVLPTNGALVQVSGDVILAKSLTNKVPAGLTLYIVAKSINSPGAPVAVVRTQTSQWPMKFRLDDSLAMLPDRKLSTAGRVTVEARVSRSGTAAGQAGDLQSVPVTVDPRSAQSVHLVIDHIIG